MQPSSESVFTHRYAALVIILLVGTGTDLRRSDVIFLCNHGPSRGLKVLLRVPVWKVLLCPHQPNYSHHLPARPGSADDPKTIRPAISSLLQNSLMRSICSLTSIEIFYPPTFPPSPYQVSGTLGLLGFNTDGTAAIRIPKEKKK